MMMVKLNTGPVYSSVIVGGAAAELAWTSGVNWIECTVPNEVRRRSKLCSTATGRPSSMIAGRSLMAEMRGC
ncbi:hypothetical protein RRF57_008732 [Xylaria bambusicola]|uniref:Uncharacterized protein n=1 Tax=Xylaria bambusicola TaxID=326684 RepID=A0AAN7UTW0_9PEZI